MNQTAIKQNALATTVAILTSLFATPGNAEYELVRSSIDAGGNQPGTAGSFELSSSIGQLVESTMTANNYQLTAGFWYPLSPGDCAADGYVDLYDSDIFSTCLTGPEASDLSHECRCFDTDRNGTIDLLDFASLQSEFTGP